jgi:hypothetical protein
MTFVDGVTDSDMEMKLSHWLTKLPEVYFRPRIWAYFLGRKQKFTMREIPYFRLGRFFMVLSKQDFVGSNKKTKKFAIR